MNRKFDISAQPSGERVLDLREEALDMRNWDVSPKAYLKRPLDLRNTDERTGFQGDEFYEFMPLPVSSPHEPVTDRTESEESYNFFVRYKWTILAGIGAGLLAFMIGLAAVQMAVSKTA